MACNRLRNCYIILVLYILCTLNLPHTLIYIMFQHDLETFMPKVAENVRKKKKVLCLSQSKAHLKIQTEKGGKHT